MTSEHAYGETVDLRARLHLAYWRLAGILTALVLALVSIVLFCMGSGWGLVTFAVALVLTFGVERTRLDV